MVECFTCLIFCALHGRFCCGLFCIKSRSWTCVIFFPPSRPGITGSPLPFPYSAPFWSLQNLWPFWGNGAGRLDRSPPSSRNAGITPKLPRPLELWRRQGAPEPGGSATLAGLLQPCGGPSRRAQGPSHSVICHDRRSRSGPVPPAEF